jgi:hypothetical protein
MKKHQFVYVAKSFMANKAKPEYHRFQTKFFVTEKKALAFQKENTHYCGSSKPKYNHATVDIEVYELKKVIKGIRVTKFYDTQNWYLEPQPNNKFKVVITEDGKKAGL